jgi:energy-coupling factor transporter ATP-binding protein EcfA2
MAITVISGPEKSGKTTLANTMRNTAIQNGRGCLLLDETTEGEPKILIEKIIVGEEFPADITKHAKVSFDEKDQPVVKRGLDALPWKKDPLVLVVGDKGKELLYAIEKICPGFIAKFGPATGISTTVEKVELPNG